CRTPARRGAASPPRIRRLRTSLDSRQILRRDYRRLRPPGLLQRILPHGFSRQALCRLVGAQRWGSAGAISGTAGPTASLAGQPLYASNRRQARSRIVLGQRRDRRDRTLLRLSADRGLPTLCRVRDTEKGCAPFVAG